MMLVQRCCARLQSIERQPVRGQDQRSLRQCGVSAHGAQEQAERIAIRLRGPHRDVGADLGQHHVAGDERADFCAIERCVFGSMSITGDHLPAASIDSDLVAGKHTVEARRRLAHRARIGVLVLSQRFLALLVETVPRVQIDSGRAADGRQLRAMDLRRVILTLRHPQGHLEPLREPARQSKVIRMKMRADHALHRQAGEHAGDQLFPEIARDLRVEARVDQGPTRAIAQHPQVDVIECKRQRHAQPEHAGRHSLPGTRRRRRRERILQRSGGDG